MARIVVGSYMVRYPLGGMLSWALQYLEGLRSLGHEVFVVEKANYQDACFNPRSRKMSDDPQVGLKIIAPLLKDHGYESRWCFVDVKGKSYGLSLKETEAIFGSSDLYIDSGNHGAWNQEASNCQARVLIDGEPGFTQMKMSNALSKGKAIPQYDLYFTNGGLVGIPECKIPLLDITWHPLLNPVVTNWHPFAPANPDSRYTTVMNWKSHDFLNYRNQWYGQKSVEFAKFSGLPLLTKAELEIAVEGKGIPRAQLMQNGWNLRSAHDVTMTLQSFRDYISESRGEFSVAKNVFVKTNSGWFSDRSGVYLSYGRPVILQDTGFSKILPVGEGLFAVKSPDEAADAIDKIESNYGHHSRRARDIAHEYLESTKVMGDLLRAVGI